MTTRTNVVLDDEIIAEAKELTLLKTKKEVIDLALNELVKHLRKKRLLELRHAGLWSGNLSGMRAKRLDTD